MKLSVATLFAVLCLSTSAGALPYSLTSRNLGPKNSEVEPVSFKDQGNGTALLVIKACNRLLTITAKDESVSTPEFQKFVQQAVIKACQD